MGRWRASMAVLLIGLSLGCGLVRQQDDPVPVAATPEPTTPIETVDPTPVEEPGSTPPSTKPPAAKKKPKATPTRDPNNFTLPECAHREGKLQTKKSAKSALVKAAGKTYWNSEAPHLKLNADLVKAIAWQESGWQSNIVNCDGGRGLMQVMPDTVDMINQRFGLAYDATDHRQNAQVGANYLAWLTKAFGDQYFKKKYDLSPKKCKTHGSMCLLNMVIAGYNAGRGPVDAGYASAELPNPGYVDSVRSLMKSCYCDRY
jgi:Transglycosylase SLT domain